MPSKANFHAKLGTRVVCSQLHTVTSLVRLTCAPPLLGPPVSHPLRVGCLGVFANVLRHTVTDGLEMLESVPAAQAVRLCNTALVAWAPTTVEQYSKSLVEWR